MPRPSVRGWLYKEPLGQYPCFVSVHNIVGGIQSKGSKSFPLRAGTGANTVLSIVFSRLSANITSAAVIENGSIALIIHSTNYALAPKKKKLLGASTHSHRHAGKRAADESSPVEETDEQNAIVDDGRTSGQTGTQRVRSESSRVPDTFASHYGQIPLHRLPHNFPESICRRS